MLRLEPAPPLEITRLIDPAAAEALAGLLAGHRMVAVTGPPGVGKSRRVAEAVRRLDAHDSVLRRALWIELEGVDDPDAQLTAALTVALDVVPGRAAAADDVLARALSVEPVLLVLDGVDAVLDGLLPRLADWLARVPTLRVVTTSQRRPALLGAVIHAVDPLTDEVAVELLVDRITAAGGSAGERDVLTRIARQLDGLPLAIELAAPRIALLGAEAMARHLEGCGALLDLSARSVSRGRTSLRGALETAWSLLDEPARLTWMQASVLGETFDMDDLLALGDGETVGASIESLATLCDASLVMRDEVPGRFRLLGALRRFAAEALDARPELAAGVRDSHRRRVAAWAAEQGRRVDGPDGIDALAALRARRPELERVAGHELEAALALGHVLRVETSADLHVDHLDRLAERIEPGTRLAARVALMRAHGHFVLDDHARALHIARDALDSALDDRELRDALRALVLRVRLQEHPGAADVLADIDALRAERADLEPAAVDGTLATLAGVGALFVDDLQSALDHLDAAVALHTRHGTPPALVPALHNRATAALWQARPERARRDLECALDLVRQLGPRHGQQLDTLVRLGWVCLDLGDRDRAVARLEEARSLARILARPREAMHAELLLGTTALDAGDLAAARTWLHRARDAVDTTTDPVYAVRIELELAELARLADDLDAARGHLQTLVERADAGQAYVIAARACLGAVEAAAGDLDAARDHLGQAERGLDQLWLPALSEHVSLQRACVEWSAGRLESSALREVLTGVLAGRDDQLSAWSSSVSTRQATRHLLRLLPAELRDRVVLEAIDPETRALVVDRGTSPVTFRMPGADTAFDVGRRALLERLLLALVEHHGEAPLDLDGMVAAGWPDEQILPDAAANRLHKALSQLRRLPGVRDALHTVDGGWQLDPDARLVELPLD